MIKKVKGEGLWTDWVDTRTGKHSLTENIQPKLVGKWCKNTKHDYYVTDMVKRLCVCKKCKHEGKFVIGRDKVKGNKVILG